MRGNSIALAAAVAACLAGLALVNNAQNNTAVDPHAKAIESMKADAAKAKAAAASPAPSASGMPPKDALATELTVGDPKTAKTHLTLGYTVDDTVAANPGPAEAAIDAARSWASRHPGASLQVACVDIPADQRADPGTADIPMGLAVNGVALPGKDGNVGSPGMTASDIQSALSSLKP